jgi:hypothetical protein
MIASRQIAFGGGKRKPYDAEVEYLESTGNQYIDTGVSFSAPCSMSVSISFTPIMAEMDFFGAYIRTNMNNMNMVCGCYQKFVFLFNWPGSRVDSSSLGDSEVYANIQCVFSGSGASGTRTLTVNGSTYTRSGAYYNNQLIILFKANFSGAFKLYAFKIYDENNVLVRDYIPVRVGDVGYMYDKVSGKLFGNQGTGAFIIGDDV